MSQKNFSTFDEILKNKDNMNRLMERQPCSEDYEIILETRIKQIGRKFTGLRALEDQKYAISETRDPPGYLHCKNSKTEVREAYPMLCLSLI